MQTLIRQRTRTTRQATAAGALTLAHDWSEVFIGQARIALTAALQQWLPSRRWFRGKARTIASLGIREQIAVAMARQQRAFLLLFEVKYREGAPETYVLPLACAMGPKAAAIERDWPQLILGRVAINSLRQNGVLYDAIVSKEFCLALLALTSEPHKVTGRAGELEAEPTGVLRQISLKQGLDIEPKVSKAEQSNSSVIYGTSLILKFFRRLDAGINPELEMERFLAAPISPMLAIGRRVGIS